MKKANSDREDRKKGITAVLVLEMIGKPPEHLVKTLEKMIDDMSEEKGVYLINKKINEPLLMENSKEFYSTFAEVEIEVEDILYLAILMFKYMPAHIEVIEPELIALTNTGWSDILSELTRRLHGYEEIARILKLEHHKMQTKIEELSSDKKEEKVTKGKTK